MDEALRFSPLISVAVLYAARLKELGTRRSLVPGPVRERMTFRLFMLAGIVAAVGGTVEYLLLRHAPDWWTVAGGWAVALASFAIRRRAIAALGKFWSLHVEIRDTHQFVRSGPFRWVRHPAYFSMILEILAAGLILRAWFSLAAACVIFLPALAARVRLEERALIEKFGAAYEEYRRTVPAFFPIRFPKCA